MSGWPGWQELEAVMNTAAGFQNVVPFATTLLALADRVCRIEVVGRRLGLLADLCRPPGEVLVVVLLSDPSVASYVRALSAGATAAVRRDGSPNAVREAFEAALAGKVILPAAVVRALASTGGHAEQAPGPPAPTTLEADWLRQLARGTTVARLAEQAGYSERMMFRLLRDLYRKLGGTNRTDALMRARDQGWI